MNSAGEVMGQIGLTGEQITSVCVFLLWLVVSAATLRDVITGGKKLFNAPSVLEPVDEKHAEKFNGSGDKLA